MDHRQFVASLSPEQRATLTARSDLAGLRQLGLHLGAIVILAALVGIGGWPFMLPLGIALVFLFTPLHEVSHDTVFATHGLNTTLAWACGIVLCLPPAWFRFFHLAHHKHTHDPAYDPELQSPKPTTTSGYLWHITGIPLWISVAKSLWANATRPITAAYIPDRQRGWIKTEARIFLGLYAAALVMSVALGSTVLLWFWLMPLLLGQPFLRLYLMAEHTLCPHVGDMFQNTRTIYTTRLIRGLAWNMPYHAEHHAFPMVPFHKLPHLHALAQAHLRETADGYTGFHAHLRAQL